MENPHPRKNDARDKVMFVLDTVRRELPLVGYTPAWRASDMAAPFDPQAGQIEAAARTAVEAIEHRVPTELGVQLGAPLIEGAFVRRSALARSVDFRDSNSTRDMAATQSMLMDSVPVVARVNGISGAFEKAAEGSAPIDVSNIVPPPPAAAADNRDVDGQLTLLPGTVFLGQSNSLTFRSGRLVSAADVASLLGMSAQAAGVVDRPVTGPSDGGNFPSDETPPDDGPTEEPEPKGDPPTPPAEAACKCTGFFLIKGEGPNGALPQNEPSKQPAGPCTLVRRSPNPPDNHCWAVLLSDGLLNRWNETWQIKAVDDDGNPVGIVEMSSEGGLAPWLPIQGPVRAASDSQPWDIHGNTRCEYPVTVKIKPIIADVAGQADLDRWAQRWGWAIPFGSRPPAVKIEPHGTCWIVGYFNGQECGRAPLRVLPPPPKPPKDCDCTARFIGEVPEEHKDYYRPADPAGIDPEMQRVAFVRNDGTPPNVDWKASPPEPIQIDITLVGTTRKKHRVTVDAVDATGKGSKALRFHKAIAESGGKVTEWGDDDDNFDDRKVPCPTVNPLRVGVSISPSIAGSLLRSAVQEALKESRDTDAVVVTLYIIVKLDGQQCAYLLLDLRPGWPPYRRFSPDLDQRAIENRDENERDDGNVLWPLRVAHQPGGEGANNDSAYRQLVIERLRAACPNGRLYLAQDNTVRTRFADCVSGLDSAGCSWLAGIMCRDNAKEKQCKVVISTSTSKVPGYVPDNAAAATWADQPVMGSWLGESPPGSGGTGTGLGSGGRVLVKKNFLERGVEMRFWAKDVEGSEWLPTGVLAAEGLMGGTRVLVHELLHALHACRGKCQFGRDGNAKDEEDQLREFRALATPGNPTFDSAQIQNQSGNWKALVDTYHNLEEYHTIMEENSILLPIFGRARVSVGGGAVTVAWSPRFGH